MGAEATLKLLLLGEDRSAGKTLRNVGGDADRASGKFAKLGSACGKILAGGLLVGGAAMIKFGQQASDLAETQSKVAQVFGEESVDALDKFASSAATTLGQSKQTALDAAATFGIIGKSAGKSGDDLVEFSTDMTKLATDMASFSNTSPEEAIVAIGAAMRGESEPIRKYGVLLDDATLRNEALKLGLIKSIKEGLTPQQKALAAQAAILAQTKDQQGDFARTSEGLANKQRILKAQFSNLTTELGAKALPAMVKVTAAGLKMINWIDKNQVLVGVLVGVLGGLVTVIWAVNAAAKAYAAVQAALNIVMAMNPIGLVVIAIAALALGLVLAYKKSETFRNIVDGAFKVISKGASLMWNYYLKPIFKMWLNLWFTVIGALLNGAAKAFGWVPKIGGKLKAAAKEFSSFKDSVNGHLDGINKDPVVTVHMRLDASSYTAGLRSLPLMPSGGKTAGNATGTGFFAGGLSMVGERGPELVALPRGSRIYDNQTSQRMGASSGPSAVAPVTININGVGFDKRHAAREIVSILKDAGVTTGSMALA